MSTLDKFESEQKQDERKNCIEGPSVEAHEQVY